MRPALVCGWLEIARLLELGHDVAHGRGGHGKAVALDQRLAADRLGGYDVFLDDGPQDLLRAGIERAVWTLSATRHSAWFPLGSA